VSTTEVNLKSTLSYSYIQVTNEEKLVYLLVDVTPSTQTSLGHLPLNLALVLDKSGSMYVQEKLDYVKKAVMYVIDQLRSDDLTSIVVFADRERVVVPSQQIFDKGGVKNMIQRIDNISVGGGTHMHKGIVSACGEVMKNYSANRKNHVILLSDGLTVAESKCLKTCRDEAVKGISFSTLGVGNDFNQKLMMDIADATGGKSYYIDVPSDIPNIFAQELKGVQSVVVQNPTLHLKLSRNVQVRRAYKVKPLISDLGTPLVQNQTYSIKLSDLQKDEPQSVLYELILPSRQAGSYRIAQMNLEYDIPMKGERGKQLSQDIVIVYTADYSLTGIVDTYVMNLVDLVSVFRQQTRALEFAQTGDYAKATQLLRTAATTLLDRGQNDLATTFLEEAKNLEMGASSSAGTKKLEYGTRKLTQMLDDSFLPPI